MKVFLLSLALTLLTTNSNASTFGSKNWLVEVNKGNVPGHTLINKFGWRGNASTVHAQVWNSPTVTDLIYPTVGETLSVVSASTSDTVAGLGARTVYIECLETGTWKSITQTINLTGTTPSLTTISCIRFQRAWVADVGTYGGKNLGLITITGSVSTNPYGYIEPEEAQTQNSQYACPALKTCFILAISITTEANKLATFSLHKRERADVITAPFGVTRVMHEWDGVNAPLQEIVIANHKVPEKTDIYFDVEMETGTGIVQIDYDILIIDSGLVPNL